MKFIHLGDLHIGKKLNGFELLDDQKDILDKIRITALEKQADSVLISGDIYDKASPSEEAVKVFDDFITELHNSGINVFAISGNHDSEERINFGSRLFTSNNIFISGKYDGNIKCIETADEYGKIYVWLMPYIRKSYVSSLYPEKEIKNYDEAVRAVLENCNVDNTQRNIILVHQFVAGKSGDPELAGSEISAVGTVERIGYNCFDDFDYVAMGHIHSCQYVGRETCRYAGSPLKYSLEANELNRDKKLTIVEIKEKGNINIETPILVPKREIRHIKGPLQELIKNATDVDDYIYATLTDETPQLNAKSQLGKKYKNIMKLDYEKRKNITLSDTEKKINIKGASLKELVTEYFRRCNAAGSREDDWEINEEQWKYIEQAAKEAEVIE